MKKTYMLFAFLALVIGASAQSISRKAISNAGGTLTGGGSQITFTIGEPVIPSLSGGGAVLTNGFQLPGEQLRTNAVATALCPGATVSVPYQAIDIGGGNTFTAQLSDASGSFASPVSIGTLAGNASGSIAAVIPNLTPAGNGYRIRVVSDSPETVAEDNGSDISISVSFTPVVTGSTTFCPGGSTTLVAAAGFSSYAWTGGTTTASRLVTAAGTYTVSVTNSNGCSGSAVVVATVTSIVPNSSITQVNCKSGNNGTISLAPSGGVGSYTYFWNNGTTVQNRSNLAAGAYTVTVTDSQGCTKKATFTITQPQTNLLVNTNKTNVRCHGSLAGSATANPAGGVLPYSYLWSNFQTTATINNLIAGVYTCTVTDANNCSKQAVVTITQPGAFSAIPSQTNVSTPGGNNGSAQVTPSGGNPGGYTYLWNTTPASTLSSISGLTAGVYKCTISDFKGCAIKVTFIITQPPSKSSLSNAKDDIKIRLYPNPSEGFVTMEYTVKDNDNFRFTLSDDLNRTVYEKTGSLSPGLNSISYDFTLLPKGVYMIHMRTSQQSKLMRLVLQ